MRDPYEILGVSKTASEAEIKKAYRTLAKKHHPDTAGGSAADKKKFQEISGAYDIVGDKEKRAKFDRGEIDAAGNPRGFDPGAGFGGGGPFGGGFGGGQGGGARDFHYTWSGGDADEGFRAEDIFADLLGGLGGRGRTRGAGAGRPQAAKGDDYLMNITVAFEEAARGATRRVKLPDGTDIDVRIPVALKDGQQIRVRGKGGPGKNGGPPGDLLLNVAVAPHPYYVRDGNDLRMDLPISIPEAVFGGKVPVPTLTGTVELTILPGANSGQVLRLKGKGIPAHGSAGGGEQAGDLYVKLLVTLPEKGDPEFQKFLEKWKPSYDPRAKMK